jgi:acetyl esterase/lipase
MSYQEVLLDAIKQKQYHLDERGLDILIKPIPDDERPGAMDPRLLAITEPHVKGLRGLLISLAAPLLLKSRDPRRLAAFMRRFFNNVTSLPLANEVTVRPGTAQISSAAVPIRIYRGKDADSHPLPVFYYLHGGGFAAGTPDVVEEMIKRVTLHAGCVSVQADYRLAPEYPFPVSHNDCWETLKWIYQNAASFGGDRNRIYVAGDSAGGNMATVCAMRDRDEGAGMVKAQVLLYPVVNMAGAEDDNYHFSFDQFAGLPGQEKAIRFSIKSMRCGSEGVLGCVLGVKDESHPWLSPYLAALEGMPRSLIIYGEFDCLRLDSEAYARKLKAAGVNVRPIRYLGMGHAFAQNIGVYPQAEDAMIEIGRFLKEQV